MNKPQPWTMNIGWKGYWGGPYIKARSVNDGETSQDGEWYRRAEIDADETNRLLCRELDEAQKAADKYNELIMAVQEKYPDETRHETALRFITERGGTVSGVAEAQPQDSDK